MDIITELLQHNFDLAIAIYNFEKPAELDYLDFIVYFYIEFFFILVFIFLYITKKKRHSPVKRKYFTSVKKTVNSGLTRIFFQFALFFRKFDSTLFYFFYKKNIHSPEVSEYVSRVKNILTNILSYFRSVVWKPNVYRAPYVKRLKK